MNNSEFVCKAQEIHGDKYDYSKVEYTNTRSKVCIICPEHGEFWQTPHSHLCGHGCPKCGKETKSNKLKLTLSEFKRNVLVYHPEYDLSSIKEYKGRNDIVSPICPKHGIFYINARSLYRGHGCPKCGREASVVLNTKTKEAFENEAKNVHGDKYDYSKVEYVNSRAKVCIICPTHGEFWQTPNNHLAGCGCPKCSQTCAYSTEEWIKCAQKVHEKTNYGYSKVDYVNNRTKVCIICPEHGEFWQIPHDHLKGCGCYSCNESRAEKEISIFLQNKQFTFLKEHKFEWLNKQRVDFYLPEYNVVIECQGLQHFKPIEHFGGYEKYIELLERDKRKLKLCKENGLEVFYYANYDFDFPYEVYTDKEKMLSDICQMKK